MKNNQKNVNTIIEYTQKQIMEVCQKYIVPLDSIENRTVRIPTAVRVKVWQEKNGILHFKIGEFIYKEKEIDM